MGWEYPPTRAGSQPNRYTVSIRLHCIPQKTGLLGRIIGVMTDTKTAGQRLVALLDEGLPSGMVWTASERATLGLISWHAMPRIVRLLFAVLCCGVAVIAIRLVTTWLDVLNPVHEVIYNGILVGSAVLCLARGVFGRGERLAWTVIGVSVALWATGNLYWQIVLSDLAELPYPSVADGFWLAFLPVCYVGVLLLARKRMPQLDSRLWLDGIIAALTTGAVSAAVIFGAVLESTGGDSAAVATNLAYPLGDMILLGTVIGAMTAGRGRLDRSWLYFGAGIVTDVPTKIRFDSGS